jgi:biotin carboxylase
MSDVVIVIASRPQVLRAAVELGLTPVQVRWPGEPDEESLRLCAEVVATDLFDEDGVVDAVEDLHRRHRAVRVMSLSEDGLVPAARVNERHGLGGDSVETVRMLKDKSAMRRRLDEVGLSPVATRVVSSESELAQFARSVGGAVVAKPLDAGGSAGVFLVEGPTDASAVWAQVVASGRSRMLAEEYLDGQEISVEAFSSDGVHTVVAFTDKILGPRFLELGHVVPAGLTPDRRRDAADLTVALLDAVGLREGPSHTELKLTPRGPRIIESHNRIGGDNITDLVRQVHGVDFERLAVGVPLGLLSWDGSVQPPAGGAAIRFLTPAPGVVRRVRQPADEELEAGVRLSVNVAVGDTIPPLTWSPDRVAGDVMAIGVSAADALDRCERTLEAVRIETTPDAEPASIAAGPPDPAMADA